MFNDDYNQVICDNYNYNVILSPPNAGERQMKIILPQAKHQSIFYWTKRWGLDEGWRWTTYDENAPIKRRIESLF